MSCSGCGKKNNKTTVSMDTTPKVNSVIVAEKSADPQKKVRLRYYGGGFGAKKVARCSACGSAKGSYSRITSETIMFASEDAPNSLFKQVMNAGHDYWVTEKQAEYLLNNEFYTDQSGTSVCKFKRLTD